MSIWFYRSAILLLSAFAISGVWPIVYAHWSAQATCPQLGVIPACYLVLIAYSGILLSTLLPLAKTRYLFLASWSVVSLLALLGVFGELANLWHCPQTSSGIPKCFFSAGLAGLIGLLYWRYSSNK